MCSISFCLVLLQDIQLIVLSWKIEPLREWKNIREREDARRRSLSLHVTKRRQSTELSSWLADYQLHSLYIYHFRSRMLMQIYVLLNKKTNVAKWVFYRDVNRWKIQLMGLLKNGAFNPWAKLSIVLARLLRISRPICQWKAQNRNIANRCSTGLNLNRYLL